MIILYVDDDEEDRLIFNEVILTLSTDTKVAFAVNAAEALTILPGIRPDYIFLDLGLPEISGTQFLREIKASPDFNEIPVVIFTTSKDPDDKRQCLELGAVEFIHKPHAFQQACSLLKRFVQAP